MKEPVTRTAASPNAAGRPSLYSGDMATKCSGDETSILGALEPKRPNAWLGWRGVLVVMAGLLLLPVVYLGAQSSLVQQPEAQPAWLNAGSERHKTTELAPAPLLDLHVVAQSVNASDAPSVATIMTEASANSLAPEAVPEGAARVAAVTQSLAIADMERDAKRKGEPPKIATTVDARVGQKQSAHGMGARELAPIEKIGTKRLDAKYASGLGHAAPSTAKGTKNKDKDIDLIAALLSHIPTSGPANKDATYKPSNTSMDTLTSAEFSVSREKRVQSNRDIIVRVHGESTESLIKRCRALGLVEGELCRIRICSGNWGTDPACSGNARANAD